VTRAWVGPAVAFAWALLCVRWFDTAAAWRPAWLEAVPPWLLIAAVAAGFAVLGRRHGREVFVLPAGASAREMALLVAIAFAFRFPMAWTASAGYTTPDGSLSGIVALRLRDGLERLVFVPSVPYSGSLKSHVAAMLGLTIDLSRAFTLSSVLFYVGFVAALYALAAAVDPRRARLAALYAVFAPAFVTRYSLSNDGNYVEVLALGTFALWLATRAFAADERRRDLYAWTAGGALGLAFWAHILAVIPASAVVPAFIAAAPRRGLHALARLAAGFAFGALPALLWNAANGGESFRYLLPGGQSVGRLESGPPFLERLIGLAADQGPILLGYDPGYLAPLDTVLRVLAWAALAAVVAGAVAAVRRFHATRDAARGTILTFAAINLGIAAVALPYIAGNPRYLLFLVAPIAVWLAEVFGEGARLWIFGGIVALGAATSLGQWPSAERSDARWRTFLRDLQSAGVMHVYTDFSIGTKVNLLSEERIVCAADLGPTTTEYFKDYPARVAAAPRAALVAINTTAAERLERRLERKGVRYERRDLMKPVLIPERNVHPSELFPPAK
jgi:hypothetical protein